MGSPQPDFLTERCAAWDEYLEATRGQPAPQYDEIEVWAWARLEHALEQLAPAR